MQKFLVSVAVLGAVALSVVCETYNWMDFPESERIIIVVSSLVNIVFYFSFIFRALMAVGDGVAAVTEVAAVVVVAVAGDGDQSKSMRSIGISGKSTTMINTSML